MTISHGSLIPLFCGVLNLALMALLVIRGERSRPLDLMRLYSWSAFFSLCNIAIALLFHGGLFDVAAVGLMPWMALSTLACGLLALLRPFVNRWQDSLGFRAAQPFTLVRDAIVLVVASCYSFFATELLWNDLLPSLSMQFAIVGIAIIAFVLVLLHLLFQRSGVGIALGVAAFTILGVAQYFVLQFKGTVIMPGDLLSLGTAAEVAGGYAYSLTEGMAGLYVGFCIVLLLCSFVIPSLPKDTAHRRIARLATAVAAVISGVVMMVCFSTVSLSATYGFSATVWDPVGFYKSQGLVASLTTLGQNLRIEEPEGYTDESARNIESSYAAQHDDADGLDSSRAEAVSQFEEIGPSVVVIMNETYSDLSIYQGDSWGYSGAGFPAMLGDALLGGTVHASVSGGGTANSEFEFFEASTCGFIGPGKVPYTLYDFNTPFNIPLVFSDLGYETTAIHPNVASNYNRKSVYEQLGFDEFLTIEEFNNVEWFHNGIPDGVTYDKVLDILNSSDSPQFIFDLTMQNHSGYTSGNLPPEYQRDYQIEGLDPELQSQLNEYLGCIDKSDDDLAEFLDDLHSLDRPVVVVFFGDHQPGFSGTLNDLLFAGEDQLAHVQRTYETPYFIWANYDVAGREQVSEHRDMGINTLGSTMMHLIGAPLTPYQKSSLAIQSQVPIVNVNGYMGSDGIWYAFDNEESPYVSIVDDARRIQYLEFASKVQ